LQKIRNIINIYFVYKKFLYLGGEVRKYPDDFLGYIESKIESEEYRLEHLNYGKLACAVFVSDVLEKFNLIYEGHPTVKILVNNLKSFGWQEVELKNIEPGDIIVWEKNKSNHYHVGFYIGNEKAISNSWKKRFPIKHDFLFRNENLKKKERKIVKIIALF